MGGITSVLQGGKFGHGFVSGGLSHSCRPRNGKILMRLCNLCQEWWLEVRYLKPRVVSLPNGAASAAVLLATGGTIGTTYKRHTKFNSCPSRNDEQYTLPGAYLSLDAVAYESNSGNRTRIKFMAPFITV